MNQTDRMIIDSYLREWGRLRRIDRVAVMWAQVKWYVWGEAAEYVVEDDPVMNQVFAGMGLLREKFPKHYFLLELVYYERLDFDWACEKLRVTQKTGHRYKTDSINSLAVFLWGRARGLSLYTSDCRGVQRWGDLPAGEVAAPDGFKQR